MHDHILIALFLAFPSNYKFTFKFVIFNLNLQIDSFISSEDHFPSTYILTKKFQNLQRVLFGLVLRLITGFQSKFFRILFSKQDVECD